MKKIFTLLAICMMAVTSVWADNITFNETSTQVPSFTSGKNYNVTVNRTLIANQWNSLCLPFSMTAEEVTSFLKPATNGLYKIKYIYIYNDVASGYNVVEFETATKIEASASALVSTHNACMYIIKPTENISTFTVTDKTLTKFDDDLAQFTYGNWNVYSPMYALNATNNSYVPYGSYVLSGDKFYQVDQSNLTMKAFRWYITNTSSSSAKSGLGISFDGEATGLTTADIDAVAPTEGKYLENGRLVIKKNGKTFNAAGQLVK